MMDFTKRNCRTVVKMFGIKVISAHIQLLLLLHNLFKKKLLDRLRLIKHSSMDLEIIFIAKTPSPSNETPSSRD